MHTKGRSRKGQAAMEFLMTYGWAILVVLVVIGALAYFGVLNPQKFLPKKCQLPVGLTCVDHKLSITVANSVILLNNGIGTDIRITRIKFAAETALYSCDSGVLAAIVPAGDTYTHTFAGVQCVNNGGTAGLRIKGPLQVDYTSLQTNIAQSVNGTMITDLSSV